MKLVAPAVFLTVATGANAWLQRASGNASFTWYTDCSAAACGETASGYTAAVNQLMYGSPPGLGEGDACGRCFSITGTSDAYEPSFPGPFHTIVVKVTDLCPIKGNEEWCAQTSNDPYNTHRQPFHFDICADTGGAEAFFPDPLESHGSLLGHFEEVSCDQWSGSDGDAMWEGACLSGETAENWPSTACGNQGTPP